MSKDSYVLGWLTSCSPLYSSKLPDWKHHDALLKKFVGTGKVSIHVPVPQAGATNQMHRVIYDKDDRPLYHTLRGLGIVWYDSLYPIDKVSQTLDALVIDGMAVLQSVELRDRVILSPEDQYSYIEALVENLLELHKPVILIDNDNVCARVFLEKDDNVLRKLYLKYKDAQTLYVFSPYDQSKSLGISKERTRHIPFEIDRNTLTPIFKTAPEREYLLRYVGNNYYKSKTHVPVFEKLGQCGKVRVNGKFWSQEDQKNSPHVLYGPSVSLSHDNILKTYGDSVLGISGFSEMQDPSLYILRWKEFLIGGTYIINDDSPYLEHLLPEQPYNFNTLRDASVEDIREYLEEIHRNYVKAVEEQRSVAMEFFDMEKWYPVWSEVLGF